MNTSGDGQFNPYGASDKQGGFYLAYVERKGGFSNVMLQHSLQSGGFSAPVRVNSRASDGAVRNENPPKIAVGPAMEVYVVWASERERWKGNIRFARSMNGGKSFEPAIDLNSDATQRPISRAFQQSRSMRKARSSLCGSMKGTKQRRIAAPKSGCRLPTTRGKHFLETERSFRRFANAAVPQSPWIRRGESMSVIG